MFLNSQRIQRKPDSLDFEPWGSGGGQGIGSGFPLVGGLAQRRLQNAPLNVSIGSQITRCRVKNSIPP
ncbi:protein of unknown function [Legionella micdadei]|uniref:Uncharacterized protein n=1 Tax=Legionella micdadei TaxID=451 RepID=A0A098GBS4_LEGMI|nr:hypothetical protein Lmic_0972 [Legionella micdadei]CEG59415.1 protein of unknown function [Legionella micdadei]SCX89234.1 hypothetical protein SAMN02982997_00285 [Legionella micdadei]